MKIILLCILVVAMIGLMVPSVFAESMFDKSQINEKNLFVNNDYNFAINCPENWQMDEYGETIYGEGITDTSLFACYAPDLFSPYPANFMVAYIFVPPYEFSVTDVESNELLRLAISEMTYEFNNLRIIESSVNEYSDGVRLDVLYTHTDDLGTWNDVDYGVYESFKRHSVGHWLYNGDVYWVNFSSLSEDFDTKHDVFKKGLNSFVVGDYKQYISPDDPLTACFNEFNTSYEIKANLEVFVDGKKAIIPANVGMKDNCQRLIHTNSNDGIIYAKAVKEYPIEIGHFLWIWEFPLRDMDLSKSKILVNGKESPNFINELMIDGYSYKAEFISKNNNLLKESDNEESILCGEGTIYRNGQCVLDERGGGCLIATAAFGSEMAPQVQFLRELRDNTVLQTTSGTTFMNGFNQFYYSFSPQIADYERENPVFKEAVKVTLTPLLTSLTLLNYVEIDSEEEMLGYGIGIILLNIGMYFVLPATVILQVSKCRKIDI